MQSPIRIVLLAAALVAGPIAVSAPAQAGVAVSIGGGGIAFGYNDGYWDRAHQWHRWRNHRELESWRAANAEHYYAYRHTHDHGGGWREEHWWENH
jgi:hypothetical protein